MGQSTPSNLEWKLSLTETEPILADKYLTFGVGWEKAALCWPWWIDYHDTPSTPDTGQVPRTIRLRTRIRLKKHHQQLGLPLPFPFPLAFPFRFQAKWNPVGVGAGGECIVDVDVIGRRCEVWSYGERDSRWLTLNRTPGQSTHRCYGDVLTRKTRRRIRHSSRCLARAEKVAEPGPSPGPDRAES